jgi:serine/threonine protein kinase
MDDSDATLPHLPTPGPVPLSDSKLERLLGLGVENPAPADSGAEGTSGEWIGPYRLVSLLGEGGFGLVWLAEQEEPIRREVALKVIKPGMDSREIIARFEGERQALALMDHPHIAAVLDAGKTTSGQLYFAMELVRGVPLTEHCDARRLTLRQRLELFIPVCQAVQHAHQKGILHRDLKPSNILVEMVDGKAQPKVIDFGIAKALQSGTDAASGLSLLQTMGLYLVGTPLYMSPEQAGLSGLDVDSRSDIYSLGVLLYELLTGSTPLTRDELNQAGMEEVLRLIREQDPPTMERALRRSGAESSTVALHRQTELRRLTSQIRGDLEWIVVKALEKDRDRRYASAAALAEDILHHLCDEPVSAGPPGAAYRLGKLARRHKGPLVAASLVVLSLLVGISFTVWQAVRATKAENLATSRLHDAQKARDSAEALVTEGIQGMRGKLLAVGKVDLLEDMAKAAEGYFKALPPELLAQDETQRHLASLALNRATIALALGQQKEQARHAQECLRIMDDLLARQPESEALADEAAFATLSLCYLHMEASDFEALLPACDRLTARCQDWLESHPDTLWAMYYQVLAHNMVALTLVRDMGQELQGQERFLTALEITERMRMVHGETMEVCEAEGLMHAGKAKVADTLKQTDLAIEEFEAAATAFSKAIELGGDSALLREAHWSAVYRAGGALRTRAKRTGDPEEDKRGEEMLRQALEGRRKLVELEPGRGEWWRDLGNSHVAMATLHRDRKDYAAELSSRIEELRCRDEAVARSPNRPLLFSNRAKVHDELAAALLRQSPPETDRAARHLLTSLRELRHSIEMNGMALVLSNDRSEHAVKKLTTLAEQHPAEGQNWLQEAADTLTPLVGKVENFDAVASLGLIASSQSQVLAALGKANEAADAARKLAEMSAAQDTARGRVDIAAALLARAKGDLERAVPMTGEARQQVFEAAEEAIRAALKPLEADLAADPEFAAARLVQGNGLRQLGNCLHYLNRKREAADAFAAAVSFFDPKLHALDLREIHYSCASSLIDLRDTEAARNHASKAATIAEALCATKDTPPDTETLRRAGLAWTRLGVVEDQAGRSAESLAAHERGVESLTRAAGMNSRDHYIVWDLMSTKLAAAQKLLSLHKLPEAMELTNTILPELPDLAEKELKISVLQDFIGNKLGKLLGQFQSVGMHGLAADVTRSMIVLRRRAEALEGRLPEDPSTSACSMRFELVKLLHLQQKPEEAEAELKDALSEAEDSGSKALLAEAQKSASRAFREAKLYAQAEAHARAAHQIAQDQDLGWRGLFCTIELIEALRYAGKSEEALTHAEKAWELAEKKNWPGEHDRLRVSIASAATQSFHALHIQNPDEARIPAARLWAKRRHEEGLRSNPENEGAWRSMLEDTSLWMAHLVLEGQVADYRTLRTDLLKNTAPFPHGDLQQRTAFICLALPAEDAELDEITRRVEAAYRIASAADKARYAKILALALVRNGEAARALALTAPQLGSGDTQDWLLLHAVTALAHRQLGDHVAADSVLKDISNASESHQRHLTSPAARQCLLARILVREATKR